MKLPLLPYPSEVAFGVGREPILSTTTELTARTKRLLNGLDLDQYSFSIRLDAEEIEAVPQLDSNYSYVLRIHQKDIFVHAIQEWGILAALSTLSQLWIASPQQLPECEIVDEPKHPWRGLMVDVARHFITLPTLYRCCDLMHHYKMNVLHLHLSDDQGFRFGSEKFPELRSNDHYSLNELRQLVDYAADHGVRVVPELDVPGHTSSWLVNHPDWGCGEVNERGRSEFGVHRSCLNPSNPETIAAVRTLFKELVSVFPDEYVHMGGDEVVGDMWAKDASVQSWAKRHRLENTSDIQAHFTREICEYLTTLGKKTIVWDEALHERLLPSVTVQAWRGLRARDSSIGCGFPTIVSAPYYLDLNYSAGMHYAYSPEMSSHDWRHVDATVRADPVLAHVADGVRWHQDFGESSPLPTRVSGTILGGEACMWSELVSDELLLTRVWTRAPAIAERLWNGQNSESTDHMYERLKRSLQALPKLGLPNVANLDFVHPCAELKPLFEMLEPVKWYGRLLTMERVQARAEGRDESTFTRPYNQRTQLNRVIDRLPPESLTTIQVNQCIRHGEDISPWIVGWENQHQLFDECVKKYPELDELRPASEALAKIANVAIGSSAYTQELAGPFGEYLLPIALAFADDP